MTYYSSSRNGATVRLVVIHTGEGILRAVDMARFLDSNPDASAHATCDADTTIAPMVPYDRAAWTLGSGNPISDNIELCAFAGFTRAQWLSEGNITSPKGTTVRNPRAILRRAAQWAAERCRARNIPIRKLTVEQVRAGWHGICGHIDWNLAHNAGDHWDPGPGFPWDVFISDALGSSAPADNPEDLHMIIELPPSPDTTGKVLALDPARNWRIVIAASNQAVWSGHFYNWAPSNDNKPDGTGGDPHGTPAAPQDGGRVDVNEPWVYDVPPNTAKCAFEYSSNGPVSVGIYPR
jgi:hypothetical protein